MRLEGMGALCTLLAALVTVEQQSGSAATMGLLLTYALQVCALHGALTIGRYSMQAKASAYVVHDLRLVLC